ncbi:MAG TPA: xanthine dehydrogenase family protein subunit M [Dehalococcoidia bacterium]|nr:xanthine dehydrogenase family protein subunit M [Dehalococcoidia bacterium]
MRPFEYHAPTSLDEAISLLREHGESARPLAGGTDLVVQMKENATKFPTPSHIVSLLRIPEIGGIEFSEGEGLRIGAGATMAEVAESPIIRELYTAIAEGAALVGSLQTMNMATVGGNLCNAAPSADIAPPLLAFAAEAVIVSASGRRSLRLEEFFLGPGKTALAPCELLAEVRAPAPLAGTGSAYARHTPRKQMDIAVVGVAALLTLAGGRIERARVALGAVAPTPVRARRADGLLEGQAASAELFRRAAEAAAAECSPISDVRGSVEFRRHIVQVTTERMLREAAGRAGSR